MKSFIRLFLFFTIVLIGHAASSYGVAKIDTSQSVCFVQEQPDLFVQPLAMDAPVFHFDVLLSEMPTLYVSAKEFYTPNLIEPTNRSVCWCYSNTLVTTNHKKPIGTLFNVRHADYASRYSYGVC